MKLGPRKYFKSIDFDLDTKKLEDDGYYNNYRKAYRDIEYFMKYHGFKHRQGSVYNSVQKMSEIEVLDLIMDLKNDLPWVSSCVKAFDVTNIGQQHSLLSQLQEMGTELDIEEDIELDLSDIEI